ncbi:hypothetical protein ACOYX7_04305 [Enterococcus casseliflavus]
MKKVILGTTFIASLLLAGGVNAYAVTGVPDSKTIPIELAYEETATFKFNEDTTLEESVQITDVLLTDGTVEGTILNVGGTLTNLSASEVEVNFIVDPPAGFDEIVIDASNLRTLTTGPVDIDSLRTDITFTINQTFAQDFAALAEGADAPVITVTAQDGTDTGETPPL